MVLRVRMALIESSMRSCLKLCSQSLMPAMSMSGRRGVVITMSKSRSSMRRSASPASEAQCQERSVHVADALAALPKDYREVLMMRSISS